MGKDGKETIEEPRGLYFKYRVFREPDDVVSHPAEIQATYETDDWRSAVLEEVKEFIFPLKPDTDHHARVALAAYAFSVAIDDPQLAEELLDILSDLTEKTIHMEFVAPMSELAKNIGKGYSISELFGGATPKTD